MHVLHVPSTFLTVSFLPPCLPLDPQVVCPEHFGGTRLQPGGQACFNSTWGLDEEKCHPRAREPDWGSLVTVLINPRQPATTAKDLLEQLSSSPYVGVSVVVATTRSAGTGFRGAPHNVRFLEMIDEASPASSSSAAWSALVESVRTPYVLVGRDLRSLWHWARLERSVRLLSSSSSAATTVAAVAGSTRNLTGHWRAPCLQAAVSNYRLELRPGYRRSRCDCMACPVVDFGTPFMTRTELLKREPLSSSSHLGEEASFLDWFLRVQRAGLEVLLCPDVMYETYSGGGGGVAKIPRGQWRDLAGRHRFQAVATDFSPKIDHAFTCDQVHTSAADQ